jgi:EpsI family protein
MTLPSRSFCATVVLLAGTLTVSRLSETHRRDSLDQSLESIPNELSGWTALHSDTLPPGVLEVLKPSTYLSRIYEKRGSQLSLFIAYYAEQRAGESMHSPKNCLPGSGWQIWNFAAAFVPTESGLVKINQYSIQNSGDRRIVLYWYQSKKRVIASEYLGKLLTVRDALLEGKTAGSIVRIILPDKPRAPEEGKAFAAALIPKFQSCLGR